jgi:hypothetical protein
MPVPTHIVTMPYFSCRRRSACTTVAARIAPVAPSGWPERDRAAHRIDLRRIEPEVLDHRQACAANASFSSIQSMILLAQAGRLQRGRDRLLGPDAHDVGRHATHRERHEARQRRQRELLQDALADHDQRTGAVGGLRAVAGGDAAQAGGLAAGVAGAGEHRRSFASASSVVSARGPSSSATVRLRVPSAGRGQVGIASRSPRPA